jgi:hypothetical protein
MHCLQASVFGHLDDMSARDEDYGVHESGGIITLHKPKRNHVMGGDWGSHWRAGSLGVGNRPHCENVNEVVRKEHDEDEDDDENKHGKAVAYIR